LSYVVGNALATAHLQSKPIDRSLVTSIKHGKGMLITGSCQPQQFFVAQRLRIDHRL
jgi:hypothetical protein